VLDSEESMSTVMTLEEIRRRFASDWVLVEEPQLTESMEVKAGTVVFHSKDRDEVYRKAIELRPRKFAVLFTGKAPKDTAIVL
jgi:hypothetical protein